MAATDLLATILKRRGAMLVSTAVSTLLAPPRGAPPRKAGVGAKLAEAALLRVAMRSVPGAILIGGGLLARYLHERKQARRPARTPTPTDLPTAARKPAPPRR